MHCNTLCLQYTVVWRGLKIGSGNLIHTNCVFWIFRCQSIWVGISGNNPSCRIIWRNHKVLDKMTSNNLRNTRALLRLSNVVNPLNSTRGCCSALERESRWHNQRCDALQHIANTSHIPRNILQTHYTWVSSVMIGDTWYFVLQGCAVMYCNTLQTHHTNQTWVRSVLTKHTQRHIANTSHKSNLG